MDGARSNTYGSGLFVFSRDQMLSLLIPIAWLTVAAFFVILCRMAARGDEALALEQAAAPPRRRTALAGLVLWEDAPMLATRLRCPAPSRRVAVRVRGVRGRGGRCAAGS